MARPQYGHHHEQARALLLAQRPWCENGDGRRSSVADHVPPIALHELLGLPRHEPGSGCCVYRATCIDCSRRQGGQIARLLGQRGVRRTEVELVEPAPSPGPGDPCWAGMAWLAELLEVPDDATWPRFMSGAHPDAVGSYIDDFARFVKARTGRELLWFQRLAAARILEHDAEGRLVWLSWFLTVARQVGKSFLVVNLLLYAVTRAGELWPDAEAHTLFTSRTLQTAESLVRSLLDWARDAPGWTAALANGKQAVTHLASSRRLLIRGVDSAYGHTLGEAVVDEAWDVRQSSIDDSVEPATTEAGGQTGYTSTAHRRATSLCLRLRQLGLETLEAPDELLVVEWSAAPWRELDDEEGWREASPRWSERRRRRLAATLNRARAGESIDPTEPDPLAAFSAQQLNRWPARVVARTRTELLVSADAWAACEGALDGVAPGWVAVEASHEDTGAAVAVVAQVDGRFEVDGLTCASWADALVWVRKFASALPGVGLIAGASLIEQIPADMPGRGLLRRSGAHETRLALPLLRSLVAERKVVHDRTGELDRQVFTARVKLMRSGLDLMPGESNALLRCALWALWAAQTPPAVLSVR